jgi:hypothetical protein
MRHSNNIKRSPWNLRARPWPRAPHSPLRPGTSPPSPACNPRPLIHHHQAPHATRVSTRRHHLPNAHTHLRLTVRETPPITFRPCPHVPRTATFISLQIIHCVGTVRAETYIPLSVSPSIGMGTMALAFRTVTNLKYREVYCTAAVVRRHTLSSELPAKANHAQTVLAPTKNGAFLPASWPGSGRSLSLLSSSGSGSRSSSSAWIANVRLEILVIPLLCLRGRRFPRFPAGIRPSFTQ